MNTRVAKLAGLALFVVACGNPSAPTVTVRQVGFVLSNPRAMTFGLTSVICDQRPDRTYGSRDAVSFDFTSTLADIVAAKVTHFDGETLGSSAIKACALPPTPCSAETWCVVAGSSTTKGTVTGYLQANWEPTTEWRLHVDSSDGPSNEVVTTITRTEGLPFGSQAAIASLVIAPCGTESSPHPGLCSTTPSSLPGVYYGVSLIVYTPQVSGNRLVTTLKITAGGQQVFSVEKPYSEQTGSGHTTGIGGILMSGAVPAAPPFRAVATIRETDAGGTVIVEDTKELLYP